MRGLLLRFPPWPAQLPRLSSPMPVAAAIGSFIGQTGVRVTRYSGRVDWSRRRPGSAATRSKWSSSAGPSSCHPRYHSGCSGPLLRLAAVAGDRLAPPPAVGCRGSTGVCPGPADRPDLVLGGILGVVPGLLPDHAGVSASATQERRPRPSILRARADQTDLQGAQASAGGVQSPPAASAQMPARGVPTMRRPDLAASGPRGVATSLRSRRDQASRPLAGRDRRTPGR